MGLRDPFKKQAEARELFDRGARIYVPEFLAASRGAWGDYIDAIEQAGWTLEQWTIAPSGSAMPVFRRGPERVVQRDPPLGPNAA